MKHRTYYHPTKKHCLLLGYLLLVAMSFRAYAQPCLTGWEYRVPVTINAADNLTGYPVMLEMDTRILIANAKMQLAANDIRFIDENGSVLSHWIENGTYNTANTRFWIKTNALVAGSNTVYLFYGNKGAVDISNGETTFDLFDDFVGSSLDVSKWTLFNGTASNGGSATVASSFLTLSSTNPEQVAAITSNNVFANPVTVEMKVSGVAEGQAFLAQIGEVSEEGYAMVYDNNGGIANISLKTLDIAGNSFNQQVLADGNTESAGETTGVWGIQWPSLGDERFYWPGFGNKSNTDASLAYPSHIKVALGNIDDVGSISVDWMRVRPYNASEPTVSIDITNETNMVVDVELTSNGPVCEGTSLTITANTISNATYDWTGPSGFIFSSSDSYLTLENVLASQAGMYAVTASVPNNCPVGTANIQAVVNTASVAGGVSGNATVCAGDTNIGTITLDRSGTSGAVIRWESSDRGEAPWVTIQDTSFSISYQGLLETTYYRAVVQNGSCALTFSESVQIAVTTQPIVGKILGEQEVCEGEGGQLILTDYAGNILKWQQSVDGGFTYTDITNSTPFYNYTNLLQTTQFRAEIESGICGVGFTDAVIITVNPLPTVSFTVAPVCRGSQSIFNNLSSPLSNSHFIWDFGNGEGAVVQSPQYTYPIAGSFNATLTVTTDKGCSSSTTQIAMVNPIPVADFSPTNVCQDVASVFTNSSSVSSGAIATFSWDFGDGTPAVNANNALGQSHTYTSYGTFEASLTATSSAAPACSHTVVKTLTVYPKPVVAFEADNVCDGNDVIFFNQTTLAQGNLLYAWNFGDTQSSIDEHPKHAYATEGDYLARLEATNQDGNCTASITKTITIYPNPDAGFSVDDICLGATAVFSNRSSITSGLLTYQWDLGNNTIATSANPTWEYKHPDDYAVHLRATSDQGCIDDTSAIIKVNPLPTAEFSVDNVCEGDSTRFFNYASISEGELSHRWLFGDATVATQEEPWHTYSAHGIFDVKLLTTSLKGCLDSMKRTVVVYPKPRPDFLAPAVCDLDTMRFTNVSTIPSGSIESFVWDFGDNEHNINQNTFHLYPRWGSYDATLKLVSAQGCKASLTKVVRVHPLPIPSFEPDSICFGMPSEFLNFSEIPEGSLTYQWAFGDSVMGTSIVTSPTYTYLDSGTFYVKMLAISDFGCQDSTQGHAVVFPLPHATAVPDTSISKGFSAPLQATGGIEYAWMPIDDLDNSSVADPIATPLQTTTYEVTVTDENGCENTATATVTIIEDYLLYVMNVITPDGNNQNDTWYIENIETYPEASVKVFNQWGKEVFATENYQSDWGGTQGTDILPDGTYYYSIVFRNSTRTYRGALTILRNQR